MSDELDLNLDIPEQDTPITPEDLMLENLGAMQSIDESLQKVAENLEKLVALLESLAEKIGD